MTSNAQAMVMASFIGDALALGAHWQYDQAVLAADGRVADYRPPTRYHAGKNPGDFTHYGDQALVLLQSVAERGGFDLDDFFARWTALMDGYAGYLDMATKKTLERIAFGEGPVGSGSPSNDLAGASRIAPVVLALRDDPAAAVAAARAQTAMTHNNSLVLDAAEFFARAALLALNGENPDRALELALEQGDYAAMDFPKLVGAGLDKAGMETVAAGAAFGTSCHAPEAIPLTVQAIARYAKNLEGGLVETIMAGGDNAARALLVGMVLGAHLGPDAIPARWLQGLRARQAIEAALAA
ncbi:MAG: ADP-ribosylglycohydrolase family protein [Desulfovibrionaceae bacterium]|nr:ADP-ribosylglycohydrolase family protein [Desulfovibrionaceae bacterium]